MWDTVPQEENVQQSASLIWEVPGLAIVGPVLQGVNAFFLCCVLGL